MFGKQRVGILIAIYWSFPLLYMQWASLSIWIRLYLTSIFSDIKMAILAYFLVSFDYSVFILIFHLEVAHSWLNYVPWVQKKNGSCYWIQSISLCFFVWKLRPWIPRVTSEQCFLISAILLRGYKLFPFLLICCSERLLVVCILGGYT